MYRLCILSTSMLAMAIVPMLGAQSSNSNSRPIVLTDCPIAPQIEIHVPVKVPGVIAEINVKEGDHVQKDQLLAKMDDAMAQVDFDEKTAASLDTSSLYSAKAALEEQIAARDDTERLFAKRVESEEKKRLADAKVKVATFNVKTEEVKLEIAGLKVRGAEEALKRYEVRSPIDGVVVEKSREPGEAVKELEPILRIIGTDIVKIEGTVNIREAHLVHKGDLIEVYPNQSQSETNRLRGHTSSINDVKILGNGSQCASAGEDGVIILWDIVKGVQVRRMAAHDGPVRCLATSKTNPNRLVSAGVDGKILVWDLAPKKEPIAKDIDGGKLAFDLSGFAPVQTIKAQLGDVLTMTLHPKNPDVCITGHEDRQIRIWNLKEGVEKKRLSGHTNYVTSVNVTPDGKFLVSAGNDQTARIWSMDTDKLLMTHPGRSTEISRIGVSPDGVAFLFNNQAHLQSRRLDGQPLADFENRNGSFTDFAVYSPVGGLVLAADESRQIQLWEPAPAGRYPRLVRRYDGHVGRINAVDFTPDGNLFISGGDDKIVHVWSVPDLEQIRKERILGEISFVNDQAEAGSQTVAIRAEVENKDGVLTPGFFATMIVYPDLVAPKPQASASAVKPTVATGN